MRTRRRLAVSDVRFSFLGEFRVFKKPSGFVGLALGLGVLVCFVTRSVSFENFPSFHFLPYFATIQDFFPACL